MCKYRYQDKGSNRFDQPCIYPDFYAEHNEKFTDNLLIDNDGFCLFHSKDNKWKLDNDFRDKLFELIKVIPEANSNKEKYKWDYFFSGFHFPNYELFTFENTSFINMVDLSFCSFDCPVEFSNTKIHSLNTKHAVFNKIIRFKNVDFVETSFSYYATFHKGLCFINCNIQNNWFFDNCSFKKVNGAEYSELAIKECKSIHNLSFEHSDIEPFVYIYKSTFISELNFNHCLIKNEFQIVQSQINGTISFIETEFTLKENVNPMMSGVHFENIEISEKGKIVFKGKQPQADMVKSELAFHFKSDPKGLISFENFNLNKIYPKFKAKLFKLEKEGIVEIGNGCLKYKHQTEPKTILINGNLQNLVIEFVQTFSTFFISHTGMSLGFEILERNEEKIVYFYFSDQADITFEQFEEYLVNVEFDLWSLIKNPEIFKTTEQRLKNNQVAKKTSPVKNQMVKAQDTRLFIDKYLYAKDALINTMSSIFKIGARKQHYEISTKDIERMISAFNFNSKKLPENGKVVINMINNYYNTKQNFIDVSGNQNIVNQDVYKPD